VAIKAMAAANVENSAAPSTELADAAADEIPEDYFPGMALSIMGLCD
jgi:hypothetical protein